MELALTQIQFTRIGAERKNFGVIQLFTTDFYEVFAHIEAALREHKIASGRVGYIWNVGGTNKNYVYLDNAVQSIIAEFKLFNVPYGRITNANKHS